MRIKRIETPMVGHKYYQLSIPIKTEWSNIYLIEKVWTTDNSIDGDILIDSEDTESLIEMGNLIRDIKHTVKSFGTFWRALPADAASQEHRISAYWVSVHSASNFDDILVEPSDSVPTIVPYTHYEDEKSASMLAWLIKHIFEMYGIYVSVRINTETITKVIDYQH